MAGGYQPRVAAGGTALLPMGSGEAFGAGVGRAVSDLGGSLENLALVEKRLQQNEENASAGKSLADFRLAATKAATDLRNNAGPGAAGHTDQYEAWFAQNAPGVTANIQNEKVRRSVEGQLADMHSAAVGGEYEWEAAKRVEKLGTDETQAAQTGQDHIATAPSLAAARPIIDQERQAAVDRIHNYTGISDDEKAGMVRHIDHGISLTTLDLGVRTDPAQTRMLLDAGAFANLKPEEIERGYRDVEIRESQMRIAAERVQNAQIAAQKQNEDVLLKQVGDGTLVDDKSLAAAVASATARGEKSRAYDLQVAQTKNTINHVYGGGNASPEQISTALASIEGDKDWRSHPGQVIQHNQLSTLLDQQRNAEPNFEPLDFADPAAIQHRVSQAAQWAASHNGEMHVLGKDQAEELGHLAAGGPAGRSQVAEALSQLPGQAGIAAAQQVAKGDYALQQAISIPANFRAQLFEGEVLRKATPGLAPTKEIGARWGERGRIAMGYLPAQAQSAVLAGATNVYAYRAAQKGLTEFDQTLWDTTVNDMLDPSGRGGIGMWGRKPFVLPQGMPESELRARLYNMPEQIGAYYSDHKTPLPKSALLNNYTPVPIGDGIYRWVDKNGRYAAGRHGVAELNVRKLALPAPVVIPGGTPKGPVWIAPPSTPANPNDPYVQMSRGGAGH